MKGIKDLQEIGQMMGWDRPIFTADSKQVCGVHDVTLIEHTHESVSGGWHAVLECPSFDGTCKYDPDGTPFAIEAPENPDSAPPKQPAPAGAGGGRALPEGVIGIAPGTGMTIAMGEDGVLGDLTGTEDDMFKHMPSHVAAQAGAGRKGGAVLGSIEVRLTGDPDDVDKVLKAVSAQIDALVERDGKS